MESGEHAVVVVRVVVVAVTVVVNVNKISSRICRTQPIIVSSTL